MSELCSACGTSSIVTAQDCKKVFEAHARIFIYVNAVTPVICVQGRTQGGLGLKTPL